FAGENSSCPAYDQLFGSRLLVGNFELRVPIPQGFGVPRPAGLPPLTLALFYDVGAAWWTSSTAREIGGNFDPWNPVSSYGLAARVNLFGVALLEVDFVHPNDRPEKGWFWQFGFSPGF
ncbi:MAG TPA: BamA/TamA family outer membrane protein, partial [Actinomycetes bacterium]|nr:BamA/TamA family outer membrane protein [Actinomycetes bacterium]